MKDRISPNQISHFIGIAYISAYQERAKSNYSGSYNLSYNFNFGYYYVEKIGKLLPGKWLAWLQEVKPPGAQSNEQSKVDRNLGYIAADLGISLLQGKVDSIKIAVERITEFKFIPSLK